MLAQANDFNFVPPNPTHAVDNTARAQGTKFSPSDSFVCTCWRVVRRMLLIPSN